MPALGRLPFKPDDRDYPVERLEAMIAAGTAVPLEWSVPRILDQGDNGTCVAAGTLGACDCDDETHTDSHFTSADIVPFFETIAGAGPLPDGGAEVREGLKAAKKAGYISAYSLLTSAAQITSWLELHGPIVLGVDWMSGMDTPDAKGFVTFTGYVRGGVTALGLKRPLPVWVEETIELFDVISVSAGVRGTQILLAPADYLRAVGATVGPIAREAR